ncbi:MAG: TIGR00266 family protein [Thermoplasmata archaeon]
MKYKIDGDNLEMVTIQLGPQDLIYGEAGTMAYMSDNVMMNTEAEGGFMKGLKRKMSGESFFMTKFTVERGNGIVAFSGNSPGRIKPLEIAPGRDYIAQKDAFLCAEQGVDLDIEFKKKLGAGLFGGEGFILQRLSGNGIAFIHVTGDIIEKELKQGEILKVSTGKVAAFESRVDYDIQRTGGVKSSLFSGEGLFMTTLRGPGKVWLQSMTIRDLAASLKAHLPSGDSNDGPSISFG